MNRKLFILELNEFNRKLFKQAGQVYQLQNIQKLTKLHESTTLTNDVYDSGFLEPWVQWVSIHTGLPSRDHHIKHLGDVPHLSNTQIWEALSANGVSSGVFCAMNGARGRAEKCLFFLPDPWTAAEPGFPEELAKLIDLPRYISKNYLNVKASECLPRLGRFLSVLIKTGVWRLAIKEMQTLLKLSVRFPGESFPFILFTEYILSDLFFQFRNRFSPDFSVLFINSLAHLQHHHWRGIEYGSNERLKIGLTYIDRILGKVFSELRENEQLLCISGLSQKNTNEEKPWILYRQKDYATLLQDFGLEFAKIEGHMTHDAHFFFETKAALEKAKHVLEGARVKGVPLFLVEIYPETLKLFCRVDFFDELSDEEKFQAGGEEFSFFKYFKPIVVRTGKHIQMGTIFSSQPGFPKKMYNHEIFNLVLKYFGLKMKSTSSSVKNEAVLNA